MTVQIPVVDADPRQCRVLPACGGEAEVPIEKEAHGLLADGAIMGIDDCGEVRKLAEVEEELIRIALRRYRGHMSEAARRLGIGRSTLYRKLRDYGIDPADPARPIPWAARSDRPVR